jgi:hypothetical protein
MLNEFKSYPQFLADLQDEIGPEVAQDTPVVKRLITRCINDCMGYALVKPCLELLTFEKNRLVLPTSAVIIDGLVFGDYIDNEEIFDKFASNNSHSMHGLWFANYNDSVVGDLNTLCDKDYTISQGVMQFMTDYDGQVVTCRYYYQPRDEKGFPLVPEKIWNVCLSFVKWKLAERSQWKASQYRIDRSMVAEYMRQYSHYFRAEVGNVNPMSRVERAAMVSNVNLPISGPSISHLWEIY